MPSPSRFSEEDPKTATKSEKSSAVESAAEPEIIRVHVLEDGLTAHGRVWYRGQELEYTVGSALHETTQDRKGRSWLDYDDAEQMRRWGRVMFRPGPWPGQPYDDDRAAEAERRRGRVPPQMPSPSAGR